MSVKRAKLVILAVSILAVPLLMARVRSPEERRATMSDREQYGLRGPVKSRTEESSRSGMTDADGARPIRKYWFDQPKAREKDANMIIVGCDHAGFQQIASCGYRYR